VDQFLDSLIKFDKENIQDANLQAIRPYLDNPDFEPDFIRSKSFAAAGLCAWAINIVRFYEVFCDVEPKRKALAAANAELAAAREKLAKISAKIQVIMNCRRAIDPILGMQTDNIHCTVCDANIVKHLRSLLVWHLL